jgi:hypothetical protein
MMNFPRPLPASHHCRHYSYDDGPQCARGVDLSGPGAAAPCMPDSKVAVACNLREEHTDEERAAWEEWRNERAARMIKVLALIPGSSRDRKNKPFWGQRGEFACPACPDGKVRWVRAPSNGHVHAACTTEGCFGVIE